LREDLANKIGDSFRGVSNRIWDELSERVRDFIPDYFPLNYLESGLVSLFGWMKSFTGTLAYEVGKRIGYYIYDRIDMEIAKVSGHFDYLLNRFESEVNHSLEELDKMVVEAKEALNRRIWSVEVDVNDIKRRLNELEARLGEENYQGLKKLVEEIRQRLGL
jgi:hypothetical protein